MSLSQVLISNFFSDVGGIDNLMSRMLQPTVPVEYHLVTYCRVYTLMINAFVFAFEIIFHPFVEDSDDHVSPRYTYQFNIQLAAVYCETQFLENNILYTV